MLAGKSFNCPRAHNAFRNLRVAPVRILIRCLYPMTLRFAALCGLLALSAPLGQALPPRQIATAEFGGFARPDANWMLAGGLTGDPRQDYLLNPTPGRGIWVNRPGTTARGHLVSSWEHGDVAVEFDFLLAANAAARSVVYLQGRYAVEIESDRAPGLWQTARIEFAAPRFDAAGRIIEDARLVRLTVNGVDTRADESLQPSPTAPVPGPGPTGPLVIAGDRGSIAIRRLAYQPLETAEVELSDLRYDLYLGAFDTLDSYRHLKPTSSGVVDEIDERIANTTDTFALVYSGQMMAPLAGWYAFTHETDNNSLMRLRIDGRDLLRVAERKDNTDTFLAWLAPGAHPFQFDYLKRTEWGRPRIALRVEGPGLAPQPLSVAALRPAYPVPLVPIEPTADRFRTQRSFFPYTDPTKPYAGNKRVYVAAVGSPAGIHYAYDLEWHSLLAGWRGGFLDASGIWHQRGYQQQVVPTGSVVPFIGRPALAALATSTDDWPDPIADAYAEAGEDFNARDNNDGPPTALLGLPSPLVSQGYTLGADGQPTFQFTAYGVAAEDRWTPSADGRGLTRTLTFARPLDRDDFYLLLAEDESVTLASPGHYVIGDRRYYLDLPAGSPLRPDIQIAGPNQQLRAPLPRGTTSISYRLNW